MCEVVLDWPWFVQKWFLRRPRRTSEVVLDWPWFVQKWFLRRVEKNFFLRTSPMIHKRRIASTETQKGLYRPHPHTFLAEIVCRVLACATRHGKVAFWLVKRSKSARQIRTPNLYVARGSLAAANYRRTGPEMSSKSPPECLRAVSGTIPASLHAHAERIAMFSKKTSKNIRKNKEIALFPGSSKRTE